jgi:hypothetical protein
MVTGRNLLNAKPKGQLRVWYWNGEDPMEELQRRFAAVALHYGLDSLLQFLHEVLRCVDIATRAGWRETACTQLR